MVSGIEKIYIFAVFYSEQPRKILGFYPGRYVECGERGRCSGGKTCVCKDGPVSTAARLAAMPDEY